MRASVIRCDGCDLELTSKTKWGTGYFLSVSVQDVVGGSAVPMPESQHDFCGLICLGRWVRECKFKSKKEVSDGAGT